MRNLQEQPLIPAPTALRSRMVLEEPALLQDYRNLSRSKTQLSLWMDVDETVRSPSGRKEKEKLSE